MMEEIRAAVDKARTLINKISEKYEDNNDFQTNLNKLVDRIKNDKNINIMMAISDFSKIKSRKYPNINDAGAYILKSKDKKDPEEYLIVLNSNKEKLFQRFSLAHELGHLYLNHMENDLHISFHIKYDINEIDESLIKKDSLLLEEQQANAFALELLMPKKKFLKAILQGNGDYELSRMFNVTIDAVRARKKVLLNYD